MIARLGGAIPAPPSLSPVLTTRRRPNESLLPSRTWPVAMSPIASIAVGETLMEDYLLAFAMVALTAVFIGLTTVGLVEIT